MMSLVALAVGLLATQAAADPRVAAFGDACLATTPASRQGLVDLAAQRQWPTGRAPTPENLEWRDIYRAGEAIVRLDQHRASDENPGERICVVLIGPAPADWRDQVSALVSGGSAVGAPDPYDTSRYQLPPELELTVWDLPDGSRIHALRESDNTLELSVNYPTGR
ncbi:MAG: hypothetical protein HYU62_02635 [Caulobacterales bacterium]|nr:hypothetical protein [Caulobacterales bacterium]